MLGRLTFCIRGLLACCLVSCLGVLAGCNKSGSQSDQGTVEGKVKIGDASANSGNVIFTVNGTSISGPISADGSYRAIGVPPGNAQVTVTPVAAPAVSGAVGKATLEMKDGPGGQAGPPVPIPAKYGKAETSGLTFTVKSGTQTYDVTLTK